MTLYDTDFSMVEPGDFEIQVGASGKDIRLKHIATLK
jgi:hypothetical protein